MKRKCPTEGCSTVPPDPFIYCRKHAGSERDYYEAVERAAKGDGGKTDNGG